MIKKAGLEPVSYFKLIMMKKLIDEDPVKLEMSVEEARKILGKVAENMSDEEVKEQVLMIQLLAKSWLDGYEKSIFGGKTLWEFLNIIK